MATRTKAATAQVATPAQAAPAADMAAMFAAFLASQQGAAPAAAPAKAPKAAAQSAKADPAQAVEAAIKAAGGTVTRVGKSGTTPKGMPKAWVDVSFGGIRIQGNAWVKAPSK